MITPDRRLGKALLAALALAAGSQAISPLLPSLLKIQIVLPK